MSNVAHLKITCLKANWYKLEVVFMSTYDARLAALEKDMAVMTQDIIYKLDETNSAVTIIKGVVGTHGRDIKYLIGQAKTIDMRIEGLTQEVRAIQEQQHVQGQDITDIKRRLNSIDQRLDGIDQRFTSLENKFDQRFEQVLQALATLTNRP
jgi:chromosome segregation ATPase